MKRRPEFFSNSGWPDYLFYLQKKATDDRDFRPQTCTNGLVLRECKHIKNIFEDVYFTKNSYHITLNMCKNSKIGNLMNQMKIDILCNNRKLLHDFHYIKIS